MPRHDPRIDAYIAKAADFARPILKHIRRLVHAACPDVEETMKWGFPHFLHKGIVCSMAAFKEHCSFGFWNRRLILGKRAEGEGMGQFGRITSIADLPAERVLLGYIRKAVELNDAGVKKISRRLRPDPNRTVEVPKDLAAALKKNRKALGTFEEFSYSHRKEYVEWITEAKRDETRAKRLATTIEWLSQGKARNWKYQ